MGALAEFDRAIELNPNYPDVHNFRGIVLCDLDRVEEAVEAFRRAVDLSPGYIVPQLNLAFALLRAGRNPEAEAELESVLQREPDEPVASAKLEELRAGRSADKRGLGVRPGP
jgi:lipoprotein NlpI